MKIVGVHKGEVGDRAPCRTMVVDPSWQRRQRRIQRSYFPPPTIKGGP